MKIPAVVMASAFAVSILLGQLHPLHPHIVTYPLPLLASAAVLLLLLGVVAAWREFISTSGALSLAAWLGLGVLAAVFAERAIPLSTSCAANVASLAWLPAQRTFAPFGVSD
jgi:hypothetical protein